MKFTFRLSLMICSILLSLIQNTSAIASCDEPRVFSGNYTIMTQSDIEGLSGYTEVTGTLNVGVIGEESDITDLQGLECLKKVYSLNIRSNDLLISLNGLDNLENVVGNFSLWSNPNLASLEPLSNLKKVGGWLSINSNHTLTNFAGLDNLTYAKAILISLNNGLQSIQSLNNLTTVGFINIESNASLTTLQGFENITKTDHLDIQGNPSLANLEGLESLNDIQYWLTIETNPKLTTLNLDSLCEVGWDVRIINNEMLCARDVEGLVDQIQNCNGIGGDVNIDGNKLCCPDQIYQGNYTILSQADVEGLSGYTEVTGTLNVGVIGEESDITDLRGLECLKKVYSLNIRSNDLLISLNGLDNLENVVGNFSLWSNPNLASLEPLSNLKKVGGWLSINSNHTLTNFAGLDNLTYAKAILISLNNGLQSIQSLNNLTTVGFINIESNASLTTLQGFENITKTDHLDIQGNPSLANLEGLESLNDIQYWLTIETNPKLTTLNLDSLCKVGESVTITNNVMLCTSDAEALINQIQNCEGIGKTITISGNNTCDY